MEGNQNGHQSQNEIHEWMIINRKFHRHGFPSVRVLPSQDVHLSSGRYICIDFETSRSLRSSIVLLLSECERKEQIVQDLEQTNIEMKDDLTRLADEVEVLSAEAKDCKVMLECSRARVQELEKERGRSSSHSSRGDEVYQRNKSELAARCRQLEAKVAEQEKEMNKLHREVHSFVQEDEDRRHRQNQVFQDFRKRATRPHSAMDERMLDIIDAYESKIQDLKSLKKNNRIDGDGHLTNNNQTVPASESFKDILKSYERQLQEKNKRIKALEEQKDVIKLEQVSRPEMKDYRLLVQRVKTLEDLLHHHSISIPGEKNKPDPFASKKRVNTRLDNLELMPLTQCHNYLQELCVELETQDVDCLADLVRNLKEEETKNLRFQEYCLKLSEIIEATSDLNIRHRPSGLEKDTKTILCDSNMRYYLGIVESWSKDISGLGNLQNSINRLLDKLVPWVHARMENYHSVSDMTELVERVTHADKSERKVVLTEEVSRSSLESIIDHFQTLFDVPRISGIFPRMNEIYQFLGESRNVLNSLKNTLGIPSSTSSSALVEAVGKLCHRYNSSTSEQLKKLMQTDDLNSVIKRLREHKEFFPAFKGVMNKLLDILEVSNMEEVVPAARRLKLLSS